MQPDELLRLSRLARGVPRWASIVEIGTHTGLSTCHMARSAKAHVVAVDPYPPPRPNSRDDPYDLGPDGVMAEFHGNLTRLGLWGSVTPLRATSAMVAAMWQAPIGLLFVDAVHELDAVLQDYELWAPYITKGGWLALHDYDSTSYPGVVQAVEEHIMPSGLWVSSGQVGSLWTAQRI
jgi:hypothetical protein